MVVRAQKAGVEVHLGVKALPDDIAALQPDEVVVATGARALLLPIEGIDCPAILRGEMSGRKGLSGEERVDCRWRDGRLRDCRFACRIGA